MAKTIMIVEDDSDIMDIMTFILSDNGYEVASSNNSSILGQANEKFPHLILLDNRLPEGLGLEICKRFKQQWKKEGKSICPIIIISADHGVARLAESYDADGFIEKPFDIDYFLQTVDRHLVSDTG